MKKILAGCLGVLFLGFASVQGQGVDSDWLYFATNFNAVVFGDFTATGGDTEYRLAVGGKTTFTTGYSVGMPVTGLPLPTYSNATTDILISGGNLYDKAFGVNGNIVYGGTRSGPKRYMSNGNVVVQVTPVTLDASGNVSRAGTGQTWEQLLAKARSVSASMGALESQGVTVIDFSNRWQRFLTGTNEHLNVFNVTAANWNMSSSQIVISAPASSVVLVNIHGGPVSITYSSIELVGVDQNHVIYNFVDATQITTKGFLHLGSVLAPYASATLSGGAVEGTAVFGANVTTTIGFGFHNFPYAGQGVFGGNNGDIDTDGDGYTDAEEIEAGTDPFDPLSHPGIESVTLEVNSMHGMCVPSVGEHDYLEGDAVTCAVTNSAYVAGASRYVCTGWTGSGSVPAYGTGLQTEITLQTNSVIDWLWSTNHWLGLSADGEGILSSTSAWRSDGTSVQVLATATNAFGCFLKWTGDVGESATTNNPLEILLDRPRNVCAVFGSLLPPDPATVAPEVRRGEVSILARNIEFLYTGENPIQTGVDTNAFIVKCMAVVRGRVLDRDGEPLPGVKVSVFEHPEFGQTLSRLDGWYDMAVNGGGLLSLDFQREGYLRARRTEQTNWQDYSVFPDVALVTADPVGTSVQFGAGVTTSQVARASVIVDADGTRQATMIIPSGVQAYLVDPLGTTQSVDHLTLRFTEYTVGTNGPACMPSELPTSSYYTYCVELAADEAGDASVRFSEPVSFYIENFIGMPTGTPVPAAYYDWNGCPGWMAEEDGIVLLVTGSTVAGLAELDLDGDGLAEDELTLSGIGITFEERFELARLYVSGTSLWRVRTTHFTPCDYNFPFWLLDEGSVRPDMAIKDGRNAVKNGNRELTGGSIGIENGNFEETLALVGTGYALCYASDRTLGCSRYIEVSPASGTIPSTVKRVEITAKVAGRTLTKTLSRTEAQQQGIRLLWDGLDSMGRLVTGSQTANVDVSYIYEGTYGLALGSFEFIDKVVSFGTMAGLEIPGVFVRRVDIPMTKKYEITLESIQKPVEGLGGWTLNIHHLYDPIGQTVYYGDGRTSGPATHNTLRCIKTKVGTGDTGNSGDGGRAEVAQLNQPMDVCAAADGTLYIADTENNRIRKVSPNGIVTTLAGTGVAGYSGNGGSAIAAKLNKPTSVAVCAHGVVYVSDTGNHAIRKITPDGIIHTIAGDGVAGCSGNGCPAALARLNTPMGIAVNSECAIYIADSGNGRICRIGPDKRITTLTGSGEYEYDGYGDGGPAVKAAFLFPSDVAVANDGSILIADLYDARVRRVGNDGIISTVYQASSWEFGCRAVAVDPNSSAFYVVEYMTVFPCCPAMVWKVEPNGTTIRVAGINDWDAPFGEGGPATSAYLDDAEGACFGPDGGLYIADTQQHRIRRVKLDYPGFDDTEITIASEDGSQLFVFDAAGRHLRTLDAATGVALYTFDYMAQGILSSITDADGLVTTIERDALGNPKVVVGPYGHRTTLTLDAESRLTALVNPAGERNLLYYTDDGLLTNVVSRRGFAFRQEYGRDGRIVSNTDPLGGGNVLNTTFLQNGWSAELIDSLFRTNAYTVLREPDGTETRITVDAAGLTSSTTSTPTGEIVATPPLGMTVTASQGPDPRFGMQAPIFKQINVSTEWHEQEAIFDQSVTLTDSDDPLSMTHMTATATVNGRTSTATYNVTAREITSTSPMGRQGLVKTDELGRPVYAVSPGIYAVSNAYDSLGRLVQTVQGVGTGARTANFQYAPDGTLRSIKNALGETLEMFSDEIGRVTEQILPDSSLLSLEYDRSSDPVKYTLPHGETHGFGYNPVGQTERYTAPTSGNIPTNTFWTYNTERQPVSLTKPDGTVVSNAYDFAGRLSSVTASRDGEDESIDYAYDDAGRLDFVTRNGSVPVQYGYDTFLTESEESAGTYVWWDYDDDFRVTDVSLYTSDDNTLLQSHAYEYDDDGALILAGDLTLTHAAATGFLTSTVVGNIADSRQFNGFGEIADYAATSSSTSLYTATYAHDALGRIASQTETVGGTSTAKVYAYDVRGRLTSVTSNGVVSEWYAYDLNGNRTNSMNGAAVYDAQDRMLAAVGMSFIYNLNGSQTNRVVNGQTTGIAYDLFGQLKSVTLPDSRIISYDRDARSRVTAKRVDGEKVKGWIYKDGLKPLAETDEDGDLVSWFVYGTSGLSPDTMIRDGVTYRLIRDVQGSVRLVVDSATGTIAQRLDYDSFGNVLSDTNPGFQPFGFQSGLYDADTTLVQFGARWYDAKTGRWLTKDPILLEGGLNLYVFCGNDPVNYCDPWGLCEKSGYKFVKSYTDRIMKNPFSTKNIFETVKDMDINGNLENYYYDGHSYRSDEMGNIAPGYATTVAWGPILSAQAMVLAEILYMNPASESKWKDAIGSFDRNGIGMKKAFSEDPVRHSVLVVFPWVTPSYIFVNWVFYKP